MSDSDSLTEHLNKFNFENIKIDYDDPAHYRRMALRFAQEYIRQRSAAGHTPSQNDVDAYIERKYTEICVSQRYFKSIQTTTETPSSDLSSKELELQGKNT